MNFPLSLIEGIGGPELMMIMFVVLLLFGANKLPELARGFGKSMREFKKAASGVEEEVRRALEEEPVKPAPPKPSSISAPAPNVNPPDEHTDYYADSPATEETPPQETPAPAEPVAPPPPPSDKPAPPTP